MTFFDEGGGAPRAAKQQFGAADRSSVPDGTYVRVGDAEIGPGRAPREGRAPTAPTRAGTALHRPPRRPAPSAGGVDVRATLPRTKLLSPHPGALFDGTFEIGGERIEIAGWPGMVGHNWGAEHAERWVWIHAAGLRRRAGATTSTSPPGGSRSAR